MQSDTRGRCYCGAVQFRAHAPHLTAAYCHCEDCRRVTGAPIAAFAAFAPDDVEFSPALDAGVSHAKGVQRWFCHSCGSPLAATFEYLPDQIYVPLGLLDEPEAIQPASHSHYGRKVTWLHMSDDLPQFDGSGRDELNKAKA